MIGKVRDIMSHRLVSVTPDDTLAQIRKIFDNLNIHHVLVVEDNEIMGVISDRDILRNLSPYVDTLGATPHDNDTLARRAHQIMTRHPRTISSDLDITEAGKVLLQSDFSCLPVVDDLDLPIGIVTWHDILRAVLSQTR